MILSSSFPRRHWWTFLLVVLLICFARTALWAQSAGEPLVVDEDATQPYRLFMPAVWHATKADDSTARGKLPPLLSLNPTPTPAPLSISMLASVPLTTVAPTITPSLPLTKATSLTWEFQFAVADSKLATQWVMKAVADDGTTAIVKRIDLRNACTIHGAVDLVGAQANFAGGYIACDLPDFETEVQNYLAVASECECAFTVSTPPWIAAAFEVLGTTDHRKQPLVAMENGFRYEIDLNNLSQVYTRWLFDSQNSLTGPVFPLTGGQRTFTGYNPAWVLHTLALDTHNAFLHDVAFTQAAMDTPDYAFLSWLPTQSLVTTPLLDYTVNPSPTTIYIGGEPGSSERFIGTIDKLTLDPGCRGFGNGDGT